MKLHATGRKHAAKSNDDTRFDQNTPLDDQRAGLVAGLITEAGAVNRLSLREQIRSLDARKAEDDLLASRRVPIPPLPRWGVLEGNWNAAVRTRTRTSQCSTFRPLLPRNRINTGHFIAIGIASPGATTLNS